MSDYPMLISNKLHSFRNFRVQSYNKMVAEGQVIMNFMPKSG